MKIGILGTRGIPNYHGGFEQFAQFLSVELVRRGHEVLVYNSSLHPYQERSFEGVQLVHCKDEEDRIGTAGQFIYDLNCIRDSKKRNFDILLQLGYTSSSIWYRLLPKKAIIVTNMDGLEWKRSKYGYWTKQFLKLAEKLAAKSSDHLVADSKGIQEHLQNTYGLESTFIAYGSDPFETADESVLKDYGLKDKDYCMLIARMEPENNIEMILEGYAKSGLQTPFLVVGKTENAFGKKMVEQFADVSFIQFLGGIYDFDVLNNLRYYSKLYFHGHSVGGTNPSLLEAMASSAQIAAHHNIFNGSILGEDALYFSSADEISTLLQENEYPEQRKQMLNNNLDKIKTAFSWNKIISEYEDLFLKLAES